MVYIGLIVQMIAMWTYSVWDDYKSCETYRMEYYIYIYKFHKIYSTVSGHSASLSTRNASSLTIYKPLFVMVVCMMCTCHRLQPCVHTQQQQKLQREHHPYPMAHQSWKSPQQQQRRGWRHSRPVGLPAGTARCSCSRRSRSCRKVMVKQTATCSRHINVIRIPLSYLESWDLKYFWLSFCFLFKSSCFL